MSRLVDGEDADASATAAAVDEVDQELNSAVAKRERIELRRDGRCLRRGEVPDAFA